MKKVLCLLLSLLALNGLARADGLEDAVSAALKKGDLVKALELLRPHADRGKVSAQYKLGVLYAPIDGNEGVKWFRLAAAQGHALAQYRLGLMYAFGNGVPQDNNEAVKWFRLAAVQGEVLAQKDLGVMYSEGMGVPQDKKQAEKWFLLAAAQGEAQAQYNLGLMYATGEVGIPQNSQEALKWTKLSAAQGDINAQHNLAVMYDRGVGVPQDVVLAYMWANLAAVKEAPGYRDRLASAMSPAQIAEGQRLSRECQKRNFKNCD